MSGAPGEAPIATVVITTHDRPEFARRAVASALSQTLTDIEVVVVDDGSTPSFVPDVCDPRLRVVRNEQAGGVSRARNAGLSAARGAWITFLDDDDVLVPDMLERSLDAASTSTLPSPVAVMSGVIVLDLDGTDGIELEPPDALRRGEDFFLERRGAAGRAANSFVIPTELLREIGGWDPDLESFQHDDLGLRVNAVASIQGIPDVLYRMTTHRTARVSGRTSAIPGDMERTLAKHPEAFARHRAAHARYLCVTGHYHLKAGHWLDAVRWTIRGVRRNPSDRRAWLFLAAALAGPHVLDGFRRVRPRDANVSFLALNRRRARKYLHRALDYPRAALAFLPGRVTEALVRRRVRTATRARSVLLLCVYRSRNTAIVAPLVREAELRGWDVRLWALDARAPVLEPHTVGEGAGPKFPLLNALLDGVDLTRFDWVVVADDDFAFGRGCIDDALAVAELAGLELFQPAHVELSHRENELTVRRSFSVARRTTFVEIGPIFAVAGSLAAMVLPFPDEHTMGWGLELEWFDLERQGARLGIVDAVPIRHLQPVGKGYAKAEQRERLRSLLRARGLESFEEIQLTEGTWRPWHPAPPWRMPPESDA